MNKKGHFDQATKKVITYEQVITTLNKIANNSGNSEAYFSSNLDSPMYGKVAGFKFSSAQQAHDLGILLNSLGIRFVEHHATLNEQVGELHIRPEHTNDAEKLFANWCSWVTIEKRITGNKEIDNKWAQPAISHSR